MSELKISIVSIAQTFVSAFLVAFGASVASGVTLQWTYAFWVSIILAAARQALKIIWQQTLPVAVGGNPPRR